MSDLLKKLAAYVRSVPEPNVHVVLSQGVSGEEIMMLPSAEPKTVKSELEGRSIDGVSVGEPSVGQIAYFMDGMQRPRGPIYINSSVPMMYGYTAAAIRVRGIDKHMRKLAHLPREAIYFPYELLDWRPYHAAGMDTVDTAERGQKTDDHPLMMAERAKNKIGDIRADLERQITTKWLADFDGRDEWLLVDGSLSGDYDRYEAPNIVGVIKSHQTQYFEWEEQQNILNLKAGERSGVFIPGGRNRPAVYSWYVRLRSNDGRDVYFGLVRVEAAKCERTLDMADEISRWILAERSPLSMPDSRWDRMIYPIRDCELYLKSLAPSAAALDSMLIGLAGAAKKG
ncbi:MAG: hypothetical protein NT018_13150 [Armatimonadetes bacterium]|nr:hypothetical protein [Armatimonadota bacterium]